jgi:hypothetical protein
MLCPENMHHGAVIAIWLSWHYLEGMVSLFDRWQIDTRKLSQHMLEQILNLALKDNVLIRGWGAAAYPDCFAIEVVQLIPLEFRVRS